MPRPLAKTAPCLACATSSSDLRRGMCFACYQRERRGTLRLYARCALCDVSDPRMLTEHPAGILCANHARVAGRKTRSLVELMKLCG